MGATYSDLVCPSLRRLLLTGGVRGGGTGGGDDDLTALWREVVYENSARDARSTLDALLREYLPNIVGEFARGGQGAGAVLPPAALRSRQRRQREGRKRRKRRRPRRKGVAKATATWTTEARRRRTMTTTETETKTKWRRSRRSSTSRPSDPRLLATFRPAVAAASRVILQRH